MFTLDRHAEILQYRIESIRLDGHVVLQHLQTRQLLHNFRDSFALTRQSLKNESNRSGAVMGQVHFRNCNTAAAFTAENGFVLDQALRNVRLSHRSTHDAAAVPRGDSVYGARSRDIRYDRTRMLLQSNLCR